MTTVEVFAGNCGFTTTIKASMQGKLCSLEIESECPDIRKIADELKEVDPFREISFRRGMPQVLEMGVQYCKHTACPVPVGILKAVEVAAGLALPQDPTIHFKEE